MLHNPVLKPVGEFSSVDRYSAPFVPQSEVASLEHKVGYDPVEGGVFVVEGFASGLAVALLAGAQGTKALDDFRDDGGEEDKVDFTRR